jgi:hypothetical protein
MSEHDAEEPQRETERKGERVPPPRLPPTAVGAGTGGFGRGRKPIAVSERTTPVQLARLMGVPPGKVIDVGFREFARLLTVREPLGFELARDLAAVFEFEARPRK